MDYITGIQNAINYIETHLTDEIEIEKVASEAAMSTFYFQRIFGILCGVTLGDYIRFRRLTLAGIELASRETKIIDIALKYGYETAESFTRAFTKFHGITPSNAKANKDKLKHFSRLSVKITLSGGNIMDYKVVEKEAFAIIEKVSIQSIDDSTNAKTIPDFWTECHQNGTVKYLSDNAVDNTYIFGVCYGNGENSKEFEYGIGALWDIDKTVPEGYRKTEIPARTWVVFECTGAMPNAMQNLWHKITAEFFPTSSLVPTYEMDIEAYTAGNMDSPDYKSEIWIPIEKK